MTTGLAWLAERGDTVGPAPTQTIKWRRTFSRLALDYARAETVREIAESFGVSLPEASAIFDRLQEAMFP